MPHSRPRVSSVGRTATRLARLIAATAWALVLVPVAGARADTFVVANTNNSGAGSLREAITDANAAAGGPSDVVDATGITGKIALQTTLPSLTGTFEIRGPGASALTVRRAASEFRIFTVAAGAEIVLSGLAIANGLTPGTETGGGILNSGTLTVRRSAVRGNSGYTGGGIRNTDDGQLSVRNSTVSGNTARQSSVGGESGAGILNRDGTVAVVNSTVSGNTTGGRGGGITNSALSMSDISVVTVANSTVAANAGSGANLYNQSNFPGAATLSIRSTIVAEPQGATSNCGSAGAASFTSQGYNLADDASCGLNATGDLPSTDPKLKPLRYNGGPTKTQAFKQSPARNKVPASHTPRKDQRGAPREGKGDIGAYELVKCGGAVVNRVGSAKRDRLRGTARRDGILGLGGNDRLTGKNGGDGICGGPGRDKLVGGKGIDRLNGGPGRDRCRGGPGNDELKSCER